MQPKRHADVDLHLRQTRSPAHALGNGFRHSRHFLILGSDVLRVSMLVCIVMRRYAAFPLLGVERRDTLDGSEARVKKVDPQAWLLDGDGRLDYQARDPAGERRQVVLGRWCNSTGMIRTEVAGFSGRRNGHWPDVGIIAEPDHCSQAHAPARHGPFVVLLEQDCANQAEDCVLDREDARDMARRLISRLSSFAIGCAGQALGIEIDHAVDDERHHFPEEIEICVTPFSMSSFRCSLSMVMVRLRICSIMQTGPTAIRTMTAPSGAVDNGDTSTTPASRDVVGSGY
jgi:hypothetical protein